MSAARDRALALVARYDQELRELLPAQPEILDAHLHLGQDIDGMVGDDEELEGLMARYGVSRAFVFCLDEPDREPAFSAANDRTLARAARSAGRLIPFVRLDLNAQPVAEARRCLDAGARGIKLHPRAQSFGAEDARLEPIFALAAERRVPILIHGGRGLPPIAAGLAALVERHAEATLIIAHAGIADMAALSAAMSGRASVFFDTSVWSAIDLLELYRRVPVEQILYASDYPYGQQPNSLLVVLRTARRAGFDDNELRGLLGGNASRLAAGEPLPKPGTPRGPDTLALPLAVARIHQYVSMAMAMLWSQQADSFGILDLALNACAEPDGNAEQLARIAELLGTAEALWRTLGALDEPRARFADGRLAFRLLHLADIEALTAP